jgi:hypothetical protein
MFQKRPEWQDTGTALRPLLEAHAPQLIDKLLKLTLAGDGSALRMCMDQFTAHALIVP